MASERMKASGNTRLFSHRRALRFALLTLTLVSTFFFVLTRLPVVDRVLVEPYLSFLATAAGLGLRVAGFGTSVDGNEIHSYRFTAAVDHACGALEIMAIFVAVTLSFPARFSKRLSGALLGIALLAVINLVRISTLFVIGATHPSILDEAHYFYGQAIMLLSAMGLWVAWMRRVTGKPANGC